jgi:quinol monooxygenase YgiN
VTNYYVYYRVDAGRVDALRIEIEKLFAKIHEQSGISGRWMRRRDEATTYMEVYEAVKDEAAFEAILARESAKLGLERKTERFVSI